MTRRLIIEGVTEDGRTFRPSDWIERISGSLSTFGSDRRIRYSHYLQPQTIEGKKCLVVDVELQQKNPSAYAFLMDFARGNKLRIRETEDPNRGPQPCGGGLCAA